MTCARIRRTERENQFAEEMDRWDSWETVGSQRRPDEALNHQGWHSQCPQLPFAPGDLLLDRHLDSRPCRPGLIDSLHLYTIAAIQLRDVEGAFICLILRATSVAAAKKNCCVL